MPSSLSSLFVKTSDSVDGIFDHYLADPHIPLPLHKAMIASVRNGGKRMRPTLTLAFADLFQVPFTQASQVGAAIEMVHCYSLIHDDLPSMDNSDMRRGRPSCWREFGEATAILAGDSLLSLAFEILTHEAAHPSSAVRLSLIRALSQDIGAAGMAGGQMLDLSPHLIDSLKTATTMQNLKTGCLFAFSCEAGAILAQRPIDDRQLLRQFGFLWGLAYQIRDDLLDIEGDSAVLGKPTGMDGDKRSLVAFLGVKESRHYLTSLQEEMTRLIKPYQQPLFDEFIAWIATSGK